MKLPGQPVGRNVTQALARLRKAGVTKLLLVTGRCVPELEALVDVSLFDAVVAENGTVILADGTRDVLVPKGWWSVREKLLEHFQEGCEEVVIAMDRDQEARARRIVLDLARGKARLEVNKDRLMILPRGFDKGSGVVAAMDRLHARHPVVSVGDGENDLAMFAVSDYRVAVENAVDALKRVADRVTSEPGGEGVLEAIGLLFPSLFRSSLVARNASIPGGLASAPRGLR